MEGGDTLALSVKFFLGKKSVCSETEQRESECDSDMSFMTFLSFRRDYRPSAKSAA
jgi:hypothetical protein